MSVKRYRDPIQGDVHWDELTTKIIDSPEFQRLDGIKVLGFAYFAYRDAKHSRFGHSVGTSWLAQKILDHTKENHRIFGIPFPYESLGEKFGSTNEERFDSAKKIVGYAALLHDLTHVPFGHTLEDEFNDFYVKHDALESTRLYHLLLDNSSELSKVFNAEKPYLASLDNQTLKRLLFLAIKFRCVIDSEGYHDFEGLIQEALERVRSGKTLHPDAEKEVAIIMLNQLSEDYKALTAEKLFHPFMNDLFANTICADLLDYVLRDARGTGLEGMGYDARVFEYFVLARDMVTGQLRLALKVYHEGKERMDLVTEILRIMKNRYLLAERVYYNKSKASASTMMSTILRKVGAPPDINPYTTSGETAIVAMTDDDLFNFMRQRIEKYDGEDKSELLIIFETLKGQRQRKLYKSALRVPYEFASRTALFPSLIGRYREGPNASRNRGELEKELNKVVGKGQNRVLVYCPPAKMQAKEIDTLICLEENRIVPLKLHYKHLVISAEVEQLNLEYHGLWTFYVFMHPDDLENNIMVSQVITRFCTLARMSLEEAKEVSPYGFKTDEELRDRYLHGWWKEKRSWIPAEAFDDIEEVVQDSEKWCKCISYDKIMENPDCYFQQFDKIFFQTQLEKYLRTVGGKNLEKQKLGFQQYLNNEYEKNPAEWMAKIGSSASRGAHKPVVPGSDVFRAALEDFTGSRGSLEQFTRKEK